MITDEAKNLIDELSNNYDLIIKKFPYLFDKELRNYYECEDEKTKEYNLINALRFSNNVKQKFNKTNSIDDLISNEILKSRLLNGLFSDDFIQIIDQNNDYDAIYNIIDFVDNYPDINNEKVNSFPTEEKKLVDSLIRKHRINDDFKLLYKKAKKSHYFLACENKKNHIKPYSLMTLEKTLENNLSEYDYKIKRGDDNNKDYKVYFNQTKLKSRLLKKLVDFKLSLTGRIKKDKIKEDGEIYIKAYISRDLNNFF
ncbi:MAG: hypothetical protein ACOCRX_04715 [Candidatus Woesearchaeota archaeon]